jgi:cupin 2 domain-containing protein
VELAQVLLQHGTLRIERIVSRGHHSPPDFWYDQAENEWVLLVSGEARLRFREKDEWIHLRPGQYLTIPAHVRHRVEWTDPVQDTVWLAVFYR